MVADGAGVIASRHRRLGRHPGRRRLGRHPDRRPDRRQRVSRLLGRGVSGLARPLAAEASLVALGSLVVLELAYAALRPSAVLEAYAALPPSAALELAYALRPSASPELADAALPPSAARGSAYALRPLAFPCSPPVQTSQPRSMARCYWTSWQRGYVIRAKRHMKRLRVGGLVIGAGSLFLRGLNKLVALTVSHTVPAIYGYRDFCVAGGLMSYGSDILDSYRFAGVSTGRVLKGENPAELPVVQATKFELVINLKTAKALGLTIPNTLIGRADELIE